MAANAQSVVELVFQGVDKTSEATRAALENLGRVSGGVKDLSQPVADFTFGAVKLEAGLLATGVALTTFAIKVAGDFDAAFRQISTLFDASDEDLAKFRENIEVYAAGSAKSIEDIMSSLSAAIGAGVDYKDSLELIAVAEKLAVATKADLQGTTEVLVSTLNAYGMESKEAGALADLMFQIIKDGKIEMDDLSRSLASVTPIAAATGISMNEVGAAIAVLTAAGMQPSTAIEALRSAISNIVKPSEQARDLAQELGIEFDVNALKSKGLAGVLQEVALKTQGSADKMAVLFGDVTGLSAVLSLTGPQAQKFGETIGNMGNSAGSVADAYEKMAGDLDNSLQRVDNAFRGLLRAIGTPLLDEAGGIADAIARVFAAIGANVRKGELGGLVSYIEGVMGDIEDALSAVARNLPQALANADLDRFKDGIEAVLDAVKDLFGELDLTTVDGLTKAINVAGTAFLGLSRYVAGVIESFKPLFDQLVAVGSGFDEFDTNILQTLGNIGGFVTQANLLAAGLNGLVPYLETLLGLLVVKQAGGLVGAFKGLVGVLPGLTTGPAGIAGLAAAFGLAGYNVGTALVPHIDDLVSRLTGSKTTLGDWIYDLVHGTDAAQELGQAAKQAGSDVDGANAAAQRSGAAWGGATGAWEEGGNALTELGKSANGLANPFEEANNKMLANLAASEKAAAASKDLAVAQADVSKNASKVVPIIDELTGAVIGFEQNMASGARGMTELGKSSALAVDGLSKTGKSAQDAMKATREYALELEKLASNERIKLIEATVQLNVAQVEADTRRIEAAFDSLNVGIESTGTLLGGLFDNLTDLASKPGTAAQRLIEEQIKSETELRQQEFELQKDLTQAQIESLRAQARAMNNGEALIKVDGAGLQPHLEAFMWEILRAVQVRVNQDGLELLVGA